GVRLTARVLLLSDVVPSKIPLRPTLQSVLVADHGIGEELVAIADQLNNVNLARLDRPETTPSVLAAHVCLLIGRADEHALSVFMHFFAPIAWPVDLGGSADERLELRSFRAVHGVHFRDIDQ